MKQMLLIAFLITASNAWSADYSMDSLTQCLKQADRDLGIRIPFFKTPEGARAKMAEAEAMLKIVRKPTSMERVALETYRYSTILCWGNFYSDNPQLDHTIVPDPIDRLSAGVITFAEYAKERIKFLKENERLIAQYEREDQERRKQEERNRFITLSCTAESGRAVGLEFQYQINEEARTIWASRGGAAPSSISIGPTEITFKQEDVATTISRNTGRFSVILDSSVFAAGTCQTITQRKF